MALGTKGPAAAPLPDPSERWLRLRTEHFTVFSNASESYTSEIALDLERFRKALTKLVSNFEVNSPTPTYIYIFKHDASFQPYKKRVGLGPANISGQFTAHRDGNYVGINATPQTDPWSVIYHEYVHYFLASNFTNVPLWFNEGAAECLSTFRSGSGEVEIGRPITEHVDQLKTSRWIALSDLFAIDTDSKDYNEGDRQGTFYAESWALVNYLAWGLPTPKAHGVEFFSQFPQGADLKDALRPIVGPDWGELEARLLKYVKRSRFTYSILEVKDLEVPPPGPSSPMTHAETLARLGDYLMRSQEGRTAEAQGHYQAAMTADPALASACAGMGYVRDAQKRPEDAAAYYERALKLDPDDPMTLFLYADSILTRFTASGPVARPAGPAPPELVHARELYRRSIRLRPDVAEAYAGLGATFAFDDDHLTEGIEALEKARAMLPSNIHVVINLAGLYARSGERSRTRELVERVLSRSSDQRTIEAGRLILLQSDLKEAERLVNTGEVDAGIALIHEVRGKTGDPSLRRQLDETLQGIDRTRARARQVEAYNRAVALFRAKDYKKAAAILEPLAAEAGDPDVTPQIQALLKRAREAMSAGTRP